MYNTYYNCTNLHGNPVCGNNVTDMSSTYYNCYNLYGNMYMYSNNVSDMSNCFRGRNSYNILNIYVLENSISMNTVLINNTRSINGTNITWVNNNGNYYCSEINTYVYPVTNITETRISNGD